MPSTESQLEGRLSRTGDLNLLASVARQYRVRGVGRFDAWLAPGGGEVQMHATLDALRATGMDARPWRPWDDEARPGDVRHFFGSRPEFLPLIEQSRRRGLRTCVSTIAWFDWRNAWRERQSLHRRLLQCGRHWLRCFAPGISSWRRRLYHAADVLLPNSQAEADQLMRLFEVPAQKIRVVPNGVDERFAAADAALFRRRFGDEPYILCPGRIEPRKNQLTLIEAARDTGLRLIVVGDVVPGHEPYLAACRRAADHRVEFVGRLEHDDPLLSSGYAAASVVAMVGWFETPGLAALEAAMTGTPLVLTSGGCTREYFGPHARYVSPDDRRAIREAVCAAFAEPRCGALADLVRHTFTWRHVAAETLRAYEFLGR